MPVSELEKKADSRIRKTRMPESMGIDVSFKLIAILLCKFNDCFVKISGYACVAIINSRANLLPK